MLFAANVPPVEAFMSNILAFPRSPSLIQAEALEYLRTEMRMQLAAACGSLQGKPSENDLCDVLDRITVTANLVSEYNAILVACGK